MRVVNEAEIQSVNLACFFFMVLAPCATYVCSQNFCFCTAKACFQEKLVFLRRVVSVPVTADAEMCL